MISSHHWQCVCLIPHTHAPKHCVALSSHVKIAAPCTVTPRAPHRSLPPHSPGTCAGLLLDVRCSCTRVQLSSRGIAADGSCTAECAHVLSSARERMRSALLGERASGGATGGALRGEL